VSVSTRISGSLINVENRFYLMNMQMISIVEPFVIALSMGDDRGKKKSGATIRLTVGYSKSTGDQ
jgi:hypothetical protein